MSEFLTVTELPDSLVDATAVSAAIKNTLINDHGMTDQGVISGEAESTVLGSNGLNNRFSYAKSGFESFNVELHYISAEEFRASAGLAPIGAGPFTGLVGRSLQKSFFPKQNSTTEKTIVVSNGGKSALISTTDLAHEFRFEADNGLDTKGSNDLVDTLGSATFEAGSTAGSRSLKLAAATNTYLGDLTPPASMFSAGENTIEWRMRPTSWTTFGALFAFNTFENRQMYAQSGNLIIQNVESGGGSLAWNGVPVTSAAYHHFALSYDGLAGFELFVDGVSQGVRSSTGAGVDIMQGWDKFLVGIDDGSTPAIQANFDFVRVWNRALTPTEVTTLSAASDDQVEVTEQPTWVAIVAHNAAVNGAQEFNPIILGRPRPVGGKEPYLSTLSAPAAALDTTIALTDAIYKDMDPDETVNAGQATEIWLTNLVDGVQEKITITATPTTLSDPTVSALVAAFPTGSLVSDFPYKLIASDLVDDAVINHFNSEDPTLLIQASNGNYEGTDICVVDAATSGVLGTIPAIINHGTEPAFVEGAVVHEEAEAAGFRNRRMFQHPGDITNFYSVVRGA